MDAGWVAGHGLYVNTRSNLIMENFNYTVTKTIMN